MRVNKKADKDCKECGGTGWQHIVTDEESYVKVCTCVVSKTKKEFND